MFLAIDSSQARLWVALGTSEDVLEVHATAELSHSEELAVIVEQLLARRSIAIKDLQALIVGSGPGSFTGLRIGYSFAKGVCLAARLKMIEIPSFDAIAAEFLSACPDVSVVSDARRGEIFIANYRAGQRSATPKIVPIGELASYRGVVVCPSALEAERLGLSQARIPQCPATALIRIGATKAASASVPNAADLAEITPFYLRAVAAKTIAERT